jgi:hypothetical protein
MKKLLFVALFLSATLASASWDSFCNGFQAGYRAGYCYRKDFCSTPIPPLCPMPPLGHDDWEGGYAEGFPLGLSDQVN